MRGEKAGTLNALPSKRIILTMINDYDFHLAICELIDNSIDMWMKNHKPEKLLIDLSFNIDEQTIQIKDNSGGVKKSDLEVMVGLGKTTADSSFHTIGVFGVGTKRAVVALAKYISIVTRHHKEKTYQIDFDTNWLSIDDEDWEMDYFNADCRRRLKNT